MSFSEVLIFQACSLSADLAAGLKAIAGDCAPTDDEMREKKCSQCNMSAWQPVTAAAVAAAPDCEVFLPAAVVITRFPAAACGTPGCSGSLKTDGRAHGMLRMTDRIVFSHLILYGWMENTTAGGILWWTYWRDLISNIQGCAQNCINAAAIEGPFELSESAPRVPHCHNALAAKKTCAYEDCVIFHAFSEIFASLLGS